MLVRLDLADFFLSVSAARASAIFPTLGYSPPVCRLLTGLANLAVWRLDVRLSALAQTLGATYGRYADDLAFSGGESLSDCAARVRTLIYRIIFEEGFAPNPDKSRVLRAGQRQVLTGLVVNAKPAVPRDA